MSGPPVSSRAADLERLRQRADDWHVTIDDVTTSYTSLIGWGTRHGEPVVLKIVKSRDEWRSGRVAAAFDGRGVVRVLEHVPGAVLMERLQPAIPLSGMVQAGADDAAIRIAAGVIREMLETSPNADGAATVEGWGEGFDRYLGSGDDRIDRDLVVLARERYTALCRTQATRRLLHGDLHHYNIVLDERRGWTAIDPKGVIGEPEFELGALLRNPHEVAALYTDPAAVRTRIDALATALDLDAGRITEWAFAQSVLSMIWTTEDHGTLESGDPAACLAVATRSLLV